MKLGLTAGYSGASMAVNLDLILVVGLLATFIAAAIWALVIDPARVRRADAPTHIHFAWCVMHRTLVPEGRSYCDRAFGYPDEPCYIVGRVGHRS